MYSKVCSDGTVTPRSHLERTQTKKNTIYFEETLIRHFSDIYYLVHLAQRAAGVWERGADT